MAPAWSSRETARLIELHGEGLSLNAIAKEMGRAKGTISKYAEAEGIDFDRGRTAKAAEAVHVDNKAKRVAAERELLDTFPDLIRQLFEPATVFSFGGAANTYAEHTLDKPTFADQKAIMQTIGTMFTTANKLAELNAGSSADHSKSMLVQMQAALLKAVEAEEEAEGGAA